MKITSVNSQEISERIGAILHKNVNIMDEKGIIVASTDPARIGMVHEGAKKLIEKNGTEIDIHSEDGLSGVRKGINVPIRISGRTIGVIGVTGNPEELQDIALVIGEMASILFMNTQKNLQREHLARQRRIFYEELLLSPHFAEDSRIVQRAGELGFPINNIQTIGVFHIADPVSEGDRLSIDDRLTSLLRTALGDTVYISHHHISQNMAVFFHFKAGSSAIERINHTLEQVQIKYGVHIYCGLSCSVENFTQISGAYAHATEAMEIAFHTSRKQCLIYESLDLEIIVSQIPAGSSAAFLENVWKTKDTQKIALMAGFLRVYFDANGSLDAISRKLFIHKNTVQYKIHKIIEQTHYDPRVLNDAAILFLACKLLRHA